MSITATSETSTRVFRTLIPIMIVVLVVFLIIGMALPVLPIHVHHDLGLGTFVVGLVAGAQFAASLVSRVWSGHFSDTEGSKPAVIVGLIAAAVSGLLYLLSLVFVASPIVSVSILLAGRAVLGGAESFIITGALAWGLGLVAHENAGKVISYVGTAMYAAFALGAPIGTALFAFEGFLAIGLATTIIPLLTLLIVVRVRGVAPQPKAKPALRKVLGAIWVPGIGLAMSSIGFGTITAFSTLLFVDRGWEPAWLPFSLFAASFIVVRLGFGHLPDRLGGARVAFFSVLAEAAGQALMWFAPFMLLGVVGAVLTGIGYSLVYPGLGVEAVQRVSKESRGLAMGAYTAFLDLALGIASPILGLIAAGTGLGSVFLVSAVLILGAAVIAMKLMRQSDTECP